MSRRRSVTSGVPQGSVLFNNFSDDTDTRIEHTLSQFEDDINLYCGANALKGWDAIQRDLDRLEQRDQENLRRIKNSKCKVLHLGLSNPCYSYKLGDSQDGALSKRTWGYWQMTSQT